MNIFYLDHDVSECAKAHCDKHVCKMIVEYAQLLSTAHYVLDGVQVGYKPTHKNHPCAVWVRRSCNHYLWLVGLWVELLLEYERRYNRVHKADELVFELRHPPSNMPISPWVDPPQCMPEDCKGLDTVAAYRQYYLKHKTTILSWKLNRPSWSFTCTDTARNCE